MSKEKSHDPINNPSHYVGHPSGVECIELAELLNFNLGNALKYLWRADLKDMTSRSQDLAKARWYIRRQIEHGDDAYVFADMDSTKTANIRRVLEVESSSSSPLLRAFVHAAFRRWTESRTFVSLREISYMIDDEIQGAS